MSKSKKCRLEIMSNVINVKWDILLNDKKMSNIKIVKWDIKSNGLKKYKVTF
jgi:hypothetical protein